MSPETAISTAQPVLDHAAKQGIPFYFSVLFFLVVIVIGFMAWSGAKIIKAFVDAKVKADADQRESYKELTERLRVVEDEHRKITVQFASLQQQSIQAMNEVASAVRELKASLHRDHKELLHTTRD